MKKEKIEKKLRSWLLEMTKKYCWLRIKFEFSEVEGVYMVSFSPASKIERSDDFNKDAMQFADDLDNEFGTDAPLFTEEEELFKLSETAETMVGHIPTPTIADGLVKVHNDNSIMRIDPTSVSAVSPVKVHNDNSWTSPIAPQVYVEVKKNFRPSASSKEINYASAA